MSDEEFEAFMKKAQAFYDTQAEETPSSENIDEESDDDDDDFPSLEVHSGDDYCDKGSYALPKTLPTRT